MIIKKTINNILIAIKKVRAEKGYSQEYMALKLGISQNAYSKIEMGRTTLTVRVLLQSTIVLEMDLCQTIESAYPISPYDEMFR